jgi:hypothetical protein
VQLAQQERGAKFEVIKTQLGATSFICSPLKRIHEALIRYVAAICSEEHEFVISFDIYKPLFG